MTEQPEALRLAKLIESNWSRDLGSEAAAELRRLHDLLGKANALARIRYERNQELLEALKEIEWSNNEQWRTDRARAAIARAEGETK